MANFEEHDGDVLKTVAMLEGHLLKGGVLDSTSTPSIEQVEEVLEEAEGEMFAILASGGFSTDIADYPALAKSYLAWFAALGTAYRMEMSHPGVQYNPRGNARWLVLKDQFNQLKKIVETTMLDRLGVSRDREALSVITGVSQDDKEVLTQDEDVVQPLFTRDLMRHPGRAANASSYRELP